MTKLAGLIVSIVLTFAIALTLIARYEPPLPETPSKSNTPPAPAKLTPAISLQPVMPATDSDALRKLHRQHAAVFVKAKPAGISRIKQMYVHERESWPVFDPEWDVRQVQLVGNLMWVKRVGKLDSGPIAYEVVPLDAEMRAQTLHNRNQAAQQAVTHKVRKLDAFETRALANLHAGEDEVIDTDGKEIVMLGALRSMKSCSSCHKVPEGTLLGAFSYRLKKKEAVQLPPVKTPTQRF